MKVKSISNKKSPINLAAKGYYSLRVYKEDGTEVKEKRVDYSKNVVTYSGAFRIFFQGNMFSTYYANIGTGVSEITRSSTGLGNRFPAASSGAGSSRASGNEVDNGDGTSTLSLVRTMVFPLGGTAGTFSEVGVSLSESGGNFIAGQLIKDEFGNPTTITVLSDEQLRVTYTIEVTYPNGEQGAPIIGSGTVSTPEGTSSYTVYGQPFFAEYAIGSSRQETRHTAGNGSNFVSSAPNSGANFFRGGADSISHDGAGTVTRLSSDVTASPSTFSNTSIRYHLIGKASTSGTPLQVGVNETSLLTPSNGTSEITAVVEFDPPLIKDATRSYKCRIETVYNI